MKQGTPAITVKQSEHDIKAFVEENFFRYTNLQLAVLLGIKLSAVRKLCYSLGLKRMEMEYFTPAQEKYLVRHYQTKGDCELTEIFQKKWPKKKEWTKKHIEKKRKYLNLNRTPDQIQAIHKRNVKAGRFKICPVKAWNKRGRSIEGEIHYWTNSTGIKYPVIKHSGRFVHWGRWAWQKTYGTIPKSKNVVFKDGNQYNLTISNLILLSNQELAKKNAGKSSQGLSDNYVAGILSPRDTHLREIIKTNKTFIEVKRKLLILNRTIYGQQNDQIPN
jgi:hypothetical protein